MNDDECFNLENHHLSLKDVEHLSSEDMTRIMREKEDQLIREMMESSPSTMDIAGVTDEMKGSSD